MTIESPNPYQSPAAVDQSDEVVEVPGIILALGRAAGLGLLGAGSLAIPVLITWLLIDEISAGGLWGLFVFSMALGWTFATSEILRIAPVQGKFATATQVWVSGGILGGALTGVLSFHSHLLPGVFPTGPPDHSQPGFWIIALLTVAIHITLLLGLQMTRKWLEEFPHETPRSESPQELTDGE